MANTKRYAFAQYPDEPYLYITRDHLSAVIGESEEPIVHHQDLRARNGELFPYTFKAWDDDGQMYFEGLLMDLDKMAEKFTLVGDCDEDFLVEVYDFFMYGWGVTRIKYYDRRTGKELPHMEIG
jgi:hypothetical protein